jgi:5-methylcytosine-specific restriction endonuclease McrA
MGRVYDKRRWRRLRLQKLRQDPFCEECRPMLVLATDVDHVKAINDGGEVWDITNLRSLCHACHSRKTRYIEQLHREHVTVKGCDANGRPLDSGHWWNK